MDPAQTERLVTSLIALLERGTAPWRRPWDATGSGHHVNLRSGRRYRGANPILLTLGMHLRGSLLPYWCGWGEARALGLAPRRGSQAVFVLRPQVHRRSAQSRVEAPLDPSASAVPNDQDAAAWVSYRPVAVFNAADLVGDALPDLLQERAARSVQARRAEPQRLAAAEAVLAAWPVPVTHGSDHACYLPGPDRILLPLRCAFHTPAAFYATWAHEVIHSTGHGSRLARDLSGGPNSPGYAREELVAELGSVLLGDRLEIGSDLANHASYLASWIALLQDSPALLLQVLSEARRAADLIAPEIPDQAASPQTVSDQVGQARQQDVAETAC
ncbi:MAG: zincin-like metallopeptidase domain-containing protein [Cyanobacteriota bacterium]|nr:zincin-like metallopeptidase domain-containing protein [Cyanobacteriota bacterium]